MHRFKDSNVKLETPLPPIQLQSNVKDQTLYKHLQNGRIRDGATKGRIDGNTTVVSPYDYKDHTVNNQLVRNFANIVELKVPCQLQIGRGKLYPPTLQAGAHGYHFKLTFNELVSMSWS